jgi:hypothetical protein
VSLNAINISIRPIRLALAGDNRIYKYLAQGVLLKCGNSYNPQAFLMQGRGVSPLGLSDNEFRGYAAVQ